MVLLLDFYIIGQAFIGESSKKFFAICDKYLGKNSDDLTADELETVIRLYEMQSDKMNSKLLLKLQKNILDKTLKGEVEVNILAFIARVYADNNVQQSSLFEALADEVYANLRLLDQDGFVNAYVALTTHRHLHGDPKLFRAALLELEQVLQGNIDRLPLPPIVDLYSAHARFSESSNKKLQRSLT